MTINLPFCTYKPVGYGLLGTYPPGLAPSVIICESPEDKAILWYSFLAVCLAFLFFVVIHLHVLATFEG